MQKYIHLNIHIGGTIHTHQLKNGNKMNFRSYERKNS